MHWTETIDLESIRTIMICFWRHIKTLEFSLVYSFYVTISFALMPFLWTQALGSTNHSALLERFPQFLCSDRHVPGGFYSWTSGNNFHGLNRHDLSYVFSCVTTDHKLEFSIGVLICFYRKAPLFLTVISCLLFPVTVWATLLMKYWQKSMCIWEIKDIWHTLKSNGET